MPLSYFPELQWLPYSRVLNTPSPSPPGTRRSLSVPAKQSMCAYLESVGGPSPCELHGAQLCSCSRRIPSVASPFVCVCVCPRTRIHFLGHGAAQPIDSHASTARRYSFFELGVEGCVRRESSCQNERLRTHARACIRYKARSRCADRGRRGTVSSAVVAQMESQAARIEQRPAECVQPTFLREYGRGCDLGGLEFEGG